MQSVEVRVGSGFGRSQVRFATFPDSAILGFCQQRIALLPRHRIEARALLRTNFVENDFGELAFRCTPCGFGPNSGCNLGNGFALFERWCFLREEQQQRHPGSIPY